MISIQKLESLLKGTLTTLFMRVGNYTTSLGTYTSGSPLCILKTYLAVYELWPLSDVTSSRSLFFDFVNLRPVTNAPNVPNHSGETLTLTKIPKDPES